MTAPLIDLPELRVKQCRDGIIMYMPHDIYIGKSLDIYGEFSSFEGELFASLVHEGMTVLDIGANIGAHTILLSKLCGPAGSVIAFEPQPFIFNMLCGNAALNSCKNVFLFNAAIGDKNGSIIVPGVDYSQSGNFGGLPLGSYEQGLPVSLFKLDDCNIKRCDFIKMDIEEMELEALRGAENLIKTFRPVIYFENNPSDKSSSTISLLSHWDYKIVLHHPPLFNPNNFYKNPENIFGEIVSINVLAIPNEKANSYLVQNTYL